jgi:aryl-alcohol dehydrogenase-like predicted oxidoreductase
MAMDKVTASGRSMKNNPGKRIYAPQDPAQNLQWPALPKYKYADVSRGPRLRSADKIRKQPGVDTIDVLQFHVWDDSWTDESESAPPSSVSKEGLIRAFGLSLNRWEPGTNQSHPHRPGRRHPGHLQHFRSGARRQALPALQGNEDRHHRAVPLDEGSLGGKRLSKPAS